MYGVLIVCTGNICRSPMAEGLLRDMLPVRLESLVDLGSAGTHAVEGNEPSTHAVLVMAAMGIDISSHRARLLRRPMLTAADLILVMEREHLTLVRRISLLGDLNLHLAGEFRADKNGRSEIDDPYGLGHQTYLECANRLHDCMEGVVRYLEEQIP